MKKEFNQHHHDVSFTVSSEDKPELLEVDGWLIPVRLCHLREVGPRHDRTIFIVDADANLAAVPIHNNYSFPKSARVEGVVITVRLKRECFSKN